MMTNAIAMGWDAPTKDEMQELFSPANLPTATHQQKRPCFKTRRYKKSHLKNKRPCLKNHKL